MYLLCTHFWYKIHLNAFLGASCSCLFLPPSAWAAHLRSIVHHKMHVIEFWRFNSLNLMLYIKEKKYQRSGHGAGITHRKKGWSKNIIWVFYFCFLGILSIPRWIYEEMCPPFSCIALLKIIFYGSNEWMKSGIMKCIQLYIIYGYSIIQSGDFNPKKIRKRSSFPDKSNFENTEAKIVDCSVAKISK